jgi:hypothetical protein
MDAHICNLQSSFPKDNESVRETSNLKFESRGDGSNPKTLRLTNEGTDLKRNQTMRAKVMRTWTSLAKSAATATNTPSYEGF